MRRFIYLVAIILFAANTVFSAYFKKHTKNNLSGKIIHSEKLNENTSEIALENIEAGIYTVKISSEKGIVYKKILVK